MGAKLERHYAEFCGYYMRGWKLETIAKHMGMTISRLKSADYVGRYNHENDLTFSRSGEVDKRTIDTKHMYELIHLLEARYSIGEWVGGRQIKFGDETIPESDPQLRELRQVVNGK